jgi:hypothetical protein
MTEDPEATRAAVQRLHELYEASLCERLDKVAGALEAARGGDRAAIEAAWFVAHGLQGSAGSYGFARISEAIGRVAARILDDIEQRAALDASAWALIDDEMKAARRAAAEKRR